MILGDLLSEELILPNLRGKDRFEVITELVDHLVGLQIIFPNVREGILTALWKRERTMSTGIGSGIAIPHTTTELASEVLIAFGRSEKGINFDALDGKPVYLVILLLVPKGQFQMHLNTLSDIAKLLRNPGFRQKLIDAPDVKTILEVIQKEDGA